MATIHLEIVTIEGKAFDDHVNMIVAPGIEGVMGILPQHTPLLTRLSFGEVQIKKDGQEDMFFAVGGGTMEVQPHHVIVLADSAERADEIDIERAEAARRRAEERLSEGKKSDMDLSGAEASLQRSIARIKVAQRRRKGGGYGTADPRDRM